MTPFEVAGPETRSHFPPAPMSTPDSARGTVLIADDEPQVRVPLAALLGRAGFTCVQAASGDEALQLLRTQPVDAVVLDIHMPGNSELETAERLRAIVPGLPVVLLTGRPSVQTAAKAVRLPITAYLTKPPVVEELTGILDEAIAAFRRFSTIHGSRERIRSWDLELEKLESQLQRTGDPDNAALPSYLQLTLRQVILMLSDLERAATIAGASAQTETERAAALLDTVRVLERTKQNFKSRELADLRKRLQALIDQTG
jgi:CheY-like chemotaxis protein